MTKLSTSPLNRWRPSRGRTAAILALLAFFMYNLNLRSITSFDTYPTRLLPISIIRHFTLNLDSFDSMRSVPEWYRAQRRTALNREDSPEKASYAVYVRGHYMSKYPVAPAILATPVYIVPVLLGLTDGPPSRMGFSRTEIVGTLLSKLAGSLAVALSVAVLYLSLLLVTNPVSALWLTAIYAFATSTWSVSSQGLWQSSMSQPLLALAIYWLLRARHDSRYTVHASIPLAVAVACRPPVAVYAAALLLYVFLAYPAQRLRFMIFPTAVAALLLSYNLYYFGSIKGGYRSEPFIIPSPAAFAGLLVSPSRGILVCSPVLIAAFAGLLLALIERQDRLLTYIAAGSLALIVLYASWPVWDGAFSYSYRLLVDLLPGLVLLMVRPFHWVTERRWRVAAFAGLAAVSVLVQVVGTFFYPCGWYESPAPVEQHRERLWDWKDPEFVRCLCAGPVYPEGLGFLRELFHNRRAEIGPRDRPEVFTEQPGSVANRGSALELFGSGAGDRAATLFRIACERDLLRFAVSAGNPTCAQVNKTLEESLAFRPATMVDVVAGQLLQVKTVVTTGPHITEIAATGPVPIPRVAMVSASASFSESSFRRVVCFGPALTVKVRLALWLNSAELPVNVSVNVPRCALFGGCSYEMAPQKASAGSR